VVAARAREEAAVWEAMSAPSVSKPKKETKKAPLGFAVLRGPGGFEVRVVYSILYSAERAWWIRGESSSL
jgi:hypothetical protein